jgi:cation:H+ antiporter
LNLGLGRIEGAFLLACLIAFTIYSYRAALRESRQVREEFKEFIGNNGSTLGQAAFIVAGLVLLVIGARFIVNSAITIATVFGISEVVIGIAAVAVGTSFPELATSIVAALRKENDIIVGNILGSNIFNIGMLGLVSVIKPVGVNPELLRFEYPVMVALAPGVRPEAPGRPEATRPEVLQITRVALLPRAPRAGDTLTAEVESNDPSQNAFLTYRWFVNGEDNAG